eukprot:1148206-Pelagomonas_calceolata.AAC.1
MPIPSSTLINLLAPDALLRRLLSTLVTNIRHRLMIVILLIPIDFFLLLLLVQGMHSASALGVLISLFDVGSVFTACGIPAQDRYVKLVRLKYCPYINPFPNLQTAAIRHADTIRRLCPCSLRNPNRSSKVTLHTISLGVVGIIYNDYTITPLVKCKKTRLVLMPPRLMQEGCSGRGVAGGKVARGRGGESKPAGAWQTTRQTFISFF